LTIVNNAAIKAGVQESLPPFPARRAGNVSPYIYYYIKFLS
jgi:hypothetical protein